MHFKSSVLPQLADIIVVLAVSVGAGVCVSGSGEGVYHGIGAVLTGCCSTWEREDTADSEGGGTGPWGCSTEAGALRCSVASSVKTVRTHTVGVREPDDVQNWEFAISCIRSFRGCCSNQIKHWDKVFKERIFISWLWRMIFHYNFVLFKNFPSVNRNIFQKAPENTKWL